MQLIKWEPFKEIDRFFDNHNLTNFSLANLGWDLAIDVFEENGNVVAKMSLPGIKPEEVDLSVDEENLTVSGRREEEKEVNKKEYYSKEIRRGSFSRTISLPKQVDPAKAEAKYSDGVLMVSMPVVKGVPQKTFKIKIE